MVEDFDPGEDDRIAPDKSTKSASYNRRGRHLMTGLFAVAAVLGFGVILLYAYNKGKQAGTGNVPPIIRAQEGPIKIRPENPGGMKVPNRDKEVFSRLENEKPLGRIERLLPPPEKPMKPPAPQSAFASKEIAKVTALGKGAGDPANANSEAPRSLVSPPSTAKEIKPLVPPTPDAPSTLSAIKSGHLPSKKVGAKTPTKRSKPSGRKKSYRVQIASLKSRPAVQKNWVAIKRKYPKLLGNLELNIQVVKLSGGRGKYFRMQAGPLASKADATKLCSSLNKRKQSCIVVRH
ncbi:MAG: hypothetical protein CMM16_06500 [Rhodospirillaceae bacterium]|nr:hypothetical protein [Rhodospirillaceae bacterium]